MMMIRICVCRCALRARHDDRPSHVLCASVFTTTLGRSRRCYLHSADATPEDQTSDLIRSADSKQWGWVVNPGLPDALTMLLRFLQVGARCSTGNQV